MEFEELKKENIVFSYQMSPGYGSEGEDGGFSITLHGNGNLRYCTYKLFDQICTLEMFKLTKSQVYEIFKVIKKHEKELCSIPEQLDNGKEHLIYSEFVFFDHEKIGVWDIQHTNLILKKMTDHTYYGKYKENMKYENIIWKTFSLICQILKKYEIELSLSSCELNHDSKIRVMWK